MTPAMPRFDRAQVLVVGDLMLDRYYHGDTARISPEAPVPVVAVDRIEEHPGGSANVALNIAALGAGVALVGAGGADAAIDHLKSILHAARVFCDFHCTPTIPTVTKLRVVSRHQQLIRLDFEQHFTAADSAAVVARALRLIAPVGALVLSDYAKGTLGDPPTLIAAARAAGVPVLVDPSGDDFGRYCGATVLTPNFAELEAVVGRIEGEAELAARGGELLAALRLEALLVTRGENGMTLLRPKVPALHLPARAREVFDVTGAGDTVIAVLAATLAAGESLGDAVVLANLAAGLVVGKLGTATVSGPELSRALHGEHGLQRGAVSREQLSTIIGAARARAEKIVFTNGCFDIIHAGHVGYLKQARALGDRLVVAVNGDTSVQRIKGAGRPINPLQRRMTVLAGLEAVDWVVDFDDDTPELLLAELCPDVLVKGGDYHVDEVIGADIVHGYGGEVCVMGFLDDCSTAAIVEYIRDSGGGGN